MHLHPFSLLTYFVHEQRAPLFLHDFLPLIWETYHPGILDLGSIAKMQTGTSEWSQTDILNG